MSYKDDALKSRNDKIRQYAAGGQVSTTMRGPTGDKMFDRQTRDGAKGRVSPLARQVFESGDEGPLNITPDALPADRSRK